MVGGVLYTTAGVRPNVAAIDAATGETLWMYRIDEGQRGDVAPRSVSRGVEYWTDGKIRRESSSSRADTAWSRSTRRPAFPTRLRQERHRRSVRRFRSADARRTASISSTSPAVVVQQRRSSWAPRWSGGTAPRSSRTRRATSAATTSAPASGCGRSTPFRSRESSATTRGRTTRGRTPGNTAVWSPLSADEELGYVYLPIESATGDYYGGHRPGNNLFASSLVCLDARTGKRIWHHQLVHHDIWDYDLASPPTLINIIVNGKPIKAVAQVNKWGYLFVFDRVNGTPVWPIEERPVEGQCAGRVVLADPAVPDQASALRPSRRE